MIKRISFFLLVVLSASSHASTDCLSIDDASYEGGCVITADILYPEDNNGTLPEAGRMLLRNFSTGEGAQKYDKPIVIVAPYPLFIEEDSDNINDEQLLKNVLADSFNGGRLYSQIVSDYGDHDIFLFSYTTDNGSFDYIQRNSFALLKGLKKINEKNNYSQSSSIAIFGSSLGGLVSKYALAYAGANDIAVNVRTWLTLDSPLRGANIPMSYQHFPQFMLNVLKDFGSIGGFNVDNLSGLTFLTLGGFELLIAGAASYEVQQVIDAINADKAAARVLLQISRDNTNSISSKQLLINHFDHSSGALKNSLQVEMDAMGLSNNFRKVVFTSTTIENNYQTSDIEANVLMNAPIAATPAFMSFSLQFNEIMPGTDDYSYLFTGYARLDRKAISDDKHRESVLRLNEFPNFNSVNSVSGTTVKASEMLSERIDEIYNLKNHVEVKQEPTFIPSFSSLDIDPEIYGYDLISLQGKDKATLEGVSPFDRIYSLQSRVHGASLTNEEEDQIYSELTSRHDLAYLTIIVNSLLLN